MGKKRKKKLNPKDYGTKNLTDLTFYSYFEQAHSKRPGFQGRKTSPEYAEKLEKTWDSSQDPTNTGEVWEISRCGRGNAKAIKK